MRKNCFIVHTNTWLPFNIVPCLFGSCFSIESGGCVVNTNCSDTHSDADPRPLSPHLHHRAVIEQLRPLIFLLSSQHTSVWQLASVAGLAGLFTAALCRSLLFAQRWGHLHTLFLLVCHLRVHRKPPWSVLCEALIGSSTPLWLILKTTGSGAEIFNYPPKFEPSLSSYRIKWRHMSRQIIHRSVTFSCSQNPFQSSIKVPRRTVTSDSPRRDFISAVWNAAFVPEKQPFVSLRQSLVKLTASSRGSTVSVKTHHTNTSPALKVGTTSFASQTFPTNDVESIENGFSFHFCVVFLVWTLIFKAHFSTYCTVQSCMIGAQFGKTLSWICDLIPALRKSRAAQSISTKQSEAAWCHYYKVEEILTKQANPTGSSSHCLDQMWA